MNSPSILLVEDSADDRELITNAFEKTGLAPHLVIARDGEEALEILFKPRTADVSRYPRLVILDLKLPKVPGLEVLKQIRANEITRRIPVVIFTSSRQERDLIESYDLGANSYVQKPIQFEDFERAVRGVERYWIELNQSPQASRNG